MTDRIGSSHMTQGSATYLTNDRFGNPNSALALNGGWTQIPSGNYFDSAQFTISVWVLPQQVGYFARILDFGNENGQGANNFILGLSYDNSKKPFIYMKSTSGNLILDTTLTLNQWQFLVATFDGSNVRIYLNGQNVMTKQSAYTFPLFRTNCFIGKSNWKVDGFSSSVLDDLRFYNRALTDSEVTQLMNYRPPGELNFYVTILCFPKDPEFSASIFD
jgi:hypothetical protein